MVALILLSGGLFRHLLNRIDAGDDWNQYGWAAPVAIFALIVAIYLTAPAGKSANARNAVSDAEVVAISAQALHHVSCEEPTHAASRSRRKTSCSKVPAISGAMRR